MVMISLSRYVDLTQNVTIHHVFKEVASKLMLIVFTGFRDG